MPDIGPVELIIILVIVVLVFGVGRLSKIGGEMGSAIREFRQGIKGAPEGKQDQPEGNLERDQRRPRLHQSPGSPQMASISNRRADVVSRQRQRRHHGEEEAGRE